MKPQDGENVLFLENQIMEYDWGSRTAIPDLLSMPSPSDNPVAELWMGAHPKAPSKVICDGEKPDLAEFIARDPEKVLGEKAAARFDGKLPFLFKALAAEKPLSVQAHPDARMAKEGFERENDRNIPLDHRRRNYKDDRAKPECICAITPFHALCGFRKIPDMLNLFETVLHPDFSDLLNPLRSVQGHSDSEIEAGLSKFFKILFMISGTDMKKLAAHAVDVAGRKTAENPAFQWMVNIHSETHAKKTNKGEPSDGPLDPGILAPLFLNYICLEPGQALFLEAGRLHSYLKGLGMELMGASDNVVRCALTSKHIDTDELYRVVRFEVRDIEVLEPERNSHGERIYPTPAEEFVLSSIKVGRQVRYVSPANRSAEIMLCASGKCRLRFGTEGGGADVEKGRSFLVPASAPAYSIEGDAELFKASIPER